jgi:ABC-type Zn uptake system ZnuABC Zn-binding protein ZnuA
VVSNGIEMLPFGEHPHEEEVEAEEKHNEGEIIGILGEPGVCEEEHHEGEEAHEHGSCDPHVWTDPHNVMVWTHNIADAFADADPAHADIYQSNADTYVEALETLDAEVEAILSPIPESRRVLVTNHEVLGYFAHRYGFEVVGVIIPGGTTLAEPDPQALADLITLIEAENVPAIFAEVSANDNLAQVVAAETGIQVVTTLYSEALSEPNGPARTYLDYLRYNAQTIADALVG